MFGTWASEHNKADFEDDLDNFDHSYYLATIGFLVVFLPIM